MRDEKVTNEDESHVDKSYLNFEGKRCIDDDHVRGVQLSNYADARAGLRETVKPHFIQTFEEMGGKWALTWIQQWIAREFSYMYEWYAFIDESSIGVPS